MKSVDLNKNMRVISGDFKGKRLFSPDNNKVRPTTDRIKESIFNILSSRNLLDGTKVLDLFCGSGALGIESISRGASLAIFVDKDPESIKLAKKNLALVGAQSYEIYNTDYLVALRKLAGKKFGLIFLDPPYDFKKLEELFENISKSDILDENGTIIFEYGSINNLHQIANMYIIETRKMGNTNVAFLENLRPKT